MCVNVCVCSYVTYGTCEVEKILDDSYVFCVMFYLIKSPLLFGVDTFCFAECNFCWRCKCTSPLQKKERDFQGVCYSGKWCFEMRKMSKKILCLRSFRRVIFVSFIFVYNEWNCIKSMDRKCFGTEKNLYKNKRWNRWHSFSIP